MGAPEYPHTSACSKGNELLRQLAKLFLAISNQNFGSGQNLKTGSLTLNLVLRGQVCARCGSRLPLKPGAP